MLLRFLLVPPEKRTKARPPENISAISRAEAADSSPWPRRVSVPALLALLDD